MQGHRSYLYLGAGTIHRAARINSMKGHRSFSHPIKPKVSEIETVDQAA